jgi:hypothetical protein
MRDVARFRLAKKLEQHIRDNMEVSKVGANSEYNYCYEGTVCALDYSDGLYEDPNEEYEASVEHFWEENWDKFLAKEKGA